MRKSLLLLPFVLLSGCKSIPNQPRNPAAKQGVISVSPPAAVLTGGQKVALLRSEAKKRGLEWFIFCVPRSDGALSYYQGQAWLKGTTRFGRDANFYIEEGVRDWWAVGSGERPQTPQDAAFLLYQKVQGPPNEIAEHKPKEIAWKHGTCDYNTVLDSGHKSNIPCEK